MTGEFPAQMASNAESASIWWRHRDQFSAIASDVLAPQSPAAQMPCVENDLPQVAIQTWKLMTPVLVHQGIQCRIVVILSIVFSKATKALHGLFVSARLGRHCFLVPIVLKVLTHWGRHFPDDIFKYIFLNGNVWIAIKIPLKFVLRVLLSIL